MEDLARPRVGMGCWWIHVRQTTLGNVVASLSEQNVYSGRQIASLANALNSHYRQISTLLSDAVKQRFCALIGELAARQSDSVARQA